MKVGHLTVVFSDGVSEKAARHLIDEIAGDAIAYEAVEAIKCDVAEFGSPEIDAFWEEALEDPHQMDVYECIAEAEKISSSDKC